LKFKVFQLLIKEIKYFFNIKSEGDMKTLITCILLFTIQLYAQSYLNVHFNNGSFKNSLIGSLEKITLSQDNEQINFHLADGTTSTENLAEIKIITLDNFPMGEPLPVELSSFTAAVKGNSVILNWRTETEVQNFGFEIERSDEISDFIKIGFVQGYGNSNSPKNYSLTDHSIPGTSLQYRLKQIDTDGKFEYSSIIRVELSTPDKFELVQNFPNPFNPSTIISYTLPKDEYVTIKVSDIVGSEISTLVNQEQKAGSYFISFDGKNLSSGVYICTIQSGNFSHSIKMLLLK
jgi:hypothetical protein